MEYTTPPSYGSTKVNVGGILKDGEIIYAGATNTATHTESAQDSDNGWPEPKSARYVWQGMTSDGKEVTAEVEGSLGPRLDRIDVMAQVPGFIKSIAGSVAGTRPYIYQVGHCHPTPRENFFSNECTVLATREAVPEAERGRH